MRIVITIAILLASCSVERKIERAVETLKKHDVLAEVCADEYPVKDSVITRDSISYDTTVVQETVTIRDTITVGGQTVYVTKQCPPHQVITKTEWKERTVWKENTARVSALQGRINAYEKKLTAITADRDKMKEGRNWWRWACLITWVIVAGYIALRIFTPFKL